jgi:hypothetical protein
MSRRFVIAVDGLTSEQEKQLREFAGKHGGWWHWIDNFWLLHSRDGESISAAKIRDRIVAINPSAKCVVFEFPEDLDWAATGDKNAKGRGMSDWLKETWVKD